MSRLSLLTASSLALVAASGCVVPVGPKWSDPDSNYPPIIALANPPEGTPLGRSSDGGASVQVEVEVVLSDQNQADNLYLRWIVDYPPYVAGKTVGALENIKPGGDSVLRTPETFSPDCATIGSRSLAEHRLLLAVSDRPFASALTSQAPDAIEGSNYRIEAFWPFTLNCQ